MLLLVASAALVAASIWREAWQTGYNEGAVDTAKAFREEAKKQGYAWHARDDGRWVWKTHDEIQELSIQPIVNAAEMDSIGQ